MSDVETEAARNRDAQRDHPGLIAPFRNKNFRLLFTGQICSLCGDQVFLVALPFFVLDHRSPTALGEVLLAFGVARIVLLPVGGILADRFASARPRLMLFADFGRMGMLAALTITLPTTLPPLLLLAILLGALEGVFLPSSMALLPDVVDESLIGPANGVFHGATMAATLVGPALGGVLVAAVGPGPSFALDAVTFGISALTMFLLASALRSGVRAGQAGDQVTVDEDSAEAPDGPEEQRSFWRLLGSSRMLGFSLLITLMVNFAYAGAEQVALPMYSKSTLLTGARGFGLLLAAFGAGSLVGALLSGRLFGWRHRGKIALALGVLQGVALAMIPLGHQLWISMTVLAVAGVAGGMLDVFYVSMLQQRLPGNLLGRSMSALMLASFGVYPASVAISGLVVQNFGVTPIFLADGIAVCAGFLVGFTSREFRNL